MDSLGMHERCRLGALFKPTQAWPGSPSLARCVCVSPSQCVCALHYSGTRHAACQGSKPPERPYMCYTQETGGNIHACMLAPAASELLPGKLGAPTSVGNRVQRNRVELCPRTLWSIYTYVGVYIYTPTGAYMYVPDVSRKHLTLLRFSTHVQSVVWRQRCREQAVTDARSCSGVDEPHTCSVRAAFSKLRAPFQPCAVTTTSELVLLMRWELNTITIT